ncbi:MAG: hypothetical protein CMK65_13745 [Pseudoalteromonas sp.]|uniref:hypothetical protein n=1 Tax=Pseudoalteromonas sp. TaxID=53249 RepID=UPI000C8BC581|nr:hypothetical protein [Pseudoalteromonas sp.]MAD04667.1 hypothetical protein [Pseudoalteromonas sp.]|tara:strand:+ start:3224 stop:3634 length:411 start_codon:yes stop_codon:yes gene_type:complete
MKIFAKLAVALFLFFIFSLYVGVAQDAYEVTGLGFKKALIFAVILFCGSFSYDISKAIVFMKDDKFDEFFTSLFKLATRLLFIAFLCIITAISYTYGTFEIKYWGTIIYLIALSQIYHVITFATQAIDSGVDGSKA